MKDIPLNISPLIESQFPAFYQEEGPKFIAFVKTYYEWLEQSNNVLYQSRNLLEYRDVDQTTEDFLVYFKEQTLKNIQFDVATNKRLLIKNALDLYRSKGTARAIDLFFKLVYGQPSSVRYPGDDVLKLSDNTWKIPIYIEVTETAFNSDFEGKQIRGVESGATAFVENYSVKKKINDQIDSSGNPIRISKNINVFFLTNLDGNFKFGEKVLHSGTTDPRNAPTIIGSLNELQVIAGASDYNVGDIVDLISNTGLNGKAIVTSVFNTTGQVDFLLVDGGWGYTTTPKILISEKVLQVNNVIVTNTSLTSPFIQFETIYQPKADIDYEDLNGSFFANDSIFVYHANNEIAGTGKIISISQDSVDPTTGNVFVSVLSGNLQANARFYNNDNTVFANTVTYVDTTAFANVMGISTFATFTLNDISTGVLFVRGEQIYQANSIAETANATIDTVARSGANIILTVSNTVGAFVINDRVYGRSSFANANLAFYSTSVGITDLSSTTVSSITITANGQGYSNTDYVNISSNTGSGAYARITTTAGGNIADITLVRGGTGYQTVPIVSIANSATPIFFNANTDVSTENDFITLREHSFINAEAIRYRVAASNTALFGLSNNGIYYVRTANSLGIKISTAPSGNTINLTAGLTENGHSFTAVVSGGSGAEFTATLGGEWDIQNGLFVYGDESNTTAFFSTFGTGSLANFEIASLNDEETVSLNTDFLSNNNIYGRNYMDIIIDASSNSALSGSNDYGFPANPSANLISGSIRSALTFDNFTIGSISLINRTNPGEDYNLDPFVTVIEPVVRGYNKKDYIITTENITSGFTLNENLQYINRKAIDSKTSVLDGFIYLDNNIFANNDIITYIVGSGGIPIGGLANGINYFVVQSDNSKLKLSLTSNGSPIIITATAESDTHFIENGSYSTFAIITEILDDNTIRAKRTSLFFDINQSANTYIKGETSEYITLLIAAEDAESISGLNSIITANVVTANGSVSNLVVLDSGFGYERFDVGSFIRTGDSDATLGTYKAFVERQGIGEGFFQTTKGFLSRDKYLHDGFFYQDYSYEIISRIPFERYFEMLKKVLHVAGTKMFPFIEIESVIEVPVEVQRSIAIRQTFNPTEVVNVIDDFFALSHNYADGQLVTYSVDTGNTVITGLSNNASYYIASANATGFKLSTEANGSFIVDVTAPLPNEIGHGIQITV